MPEWNETENYDIVASNSSKTLKKIIKIDDLFSEIYLAKIFVKKSNLNGGKKGSICENIGVEMLICLSINH